MILRYNTGVVTESSKPKRDWTELAVLTDVSSAQLEYHVLRKYFQHLGTRASLDLLSFPNIQMASNQRGGFSANFRPAGIQKVES